MRLLDVESPLLKLKEFHGENIPPYAILSHIWGNDEVTFQDIQSGHYEDKLGYKKIKHALQQTRKFDLKWCWVDTCCIDKSSSAELSEAINSMFNWYARSRICHAYLEDVPGITAARGSTKMPLERGRLKIHELTINKRYKIDLESSTEGHTSSDSPGCSPTTISAPILPLRDAPATRAEFDEAFLQCRWFRRGWTLQELIAPRHLNFYGKTWNYLGNRDLELLDLVTRRTGLGSEVLGYPGALRHIPVARCMGWMAHRQTTRKEDLAYCMLGLFGVNMPLLYGEEDEAFVRLQEELVKRFNDHSILLSYTPGRIFAASPEGFMDASTLDNCGTFRPMSLSMPSTVTNAGLRISLPIIDLQPGIALAVLDCRISGVPIGLVIKAEDRQNDTWYIARESITEPCYGISNDTRLGQGVYSVMKDLAVAARVRDILITTYDPYAEDGAGRSDICVRYDMMLKYESATPDRRSYPHVENGHFGIFYEPHMIHLESVDWSAGLPPLMQKPKITVIKFSLVEVPVPEAQDYAAFLILVSTGYPSETDRLLTTTITFGRLAVLAKDLAINDHQVLAFGGSSSPRLKHIAGFDSRTQSCTNVNVASTIDEVVLNENNFLELWRESPEPTHASIAQYLLTVRVRSSLDGNRTLSDGTVEQDEG